MKKGTAAPVSPLLPSVHGGCRPASKAEEYAAKMKERREKINALEGEIESLKKLPERLVFKGDYFYGEVNDQGRLIIVPRTRRDWTGATRQEALDLVKFIEGSFNNQHKEE